LRISSLSSLDINAELEDVVAVVPDDGDGVGVRVTVREGRRGREELLLGGGTGEVEDMLNTTLVLSAHLHKWEIFSSLHFEN
jgi:hypothetical protein